MVYGWVVLQIWLIDTSTLYRNSIGNSLDHLRQVVGFFIFFFGFFCVKITEPVNQPQV